MGKVVPTIELGTPRTQFQTPQQGTEDKNVKFQLNIRRVYEQLAKQINGQLRIGSGVPPSGTSAPSVNLDAVVVQAVSAGGGAADFSVTHNLGRIPEGYVVIRASAQQDIWDGAGAWTTTTLTLRASVNGVTLTLLVF